MDSKNKKNRIELRTWLNSYKYLPCFLRDFHDQKDIFKSVHVTYPNTSSDDISWIQGHLYTIDRFLRFMARHGYTLQRSKTNIDFVDIRTTLAETRKEQEEEFKQILADRKQGLIQ